MLKLLFVEDDQEAIKPVLRLIKEKKENVCCEVSEFRTAEEKISSFRPDIAVLDLLVRGTSQDEDIAEGLKTREFIWNKHFCPIVVHSAQPDIHDDECESHPFVISIKKGANSPQKVLKAICEFLPHVDALKEAESDIRQDFSRAMRDVAPYAFEVLDDSEQRNDMIKRSGRRRLAARMDENSADGTNLTGLEQYLHPPISEDIRLGDILKQKGGANEDPTAFRVVLTPSCDLVSSSGRSPKVSNILVARCHSINNGLKLTSWGTIGIRRLRERLPSTLAQGYFETIVPFPSLKNRIPPMVADLRDLELIPIEKINTKFCRIASLDSPFRELIAWAYLQTAGRPGLPDRDINTWRDEILGDVKNERGGEN